MIKVQNVSKSYGNQLVLDDAALAIAPGEFVVLTGDNGSGKSTLLHLILGLRRPDSGQIIWKDQVLTGAPQGAWRSVRETWGFLPQAIALPSEASIRQLLGFHARLRRLDMSIARQWLSRVGLENEIDKTVQELSGGMRQRLGIALALFFEPELIVMDEPASSLDPTWRGALTEWLGEQQERKVAVLVTSQLRELWGNKVRFCHCRAGMVAADCSSVRKA